MTPNPTDSPFFLGTLNVQGPYFQAKGEGLLRCSLNDATGAITRSATYPKAENAIWLTRVRDTLLVATERYLSPGEVTGYAVGKDGALTQAGSPQSSHGGAVCHIAVNAAGTLAFVSSYLGGVTVHRLSAEGRVAPSHQEIRYTGSGPNKANQEGPHPHQAVCLSGDRVAVCDLGSDRIWLHRVVGDRLEPAGEVAVAPGSGPRHLALHPTLPLAYVLGEIDARVRVFDLRAGGFREVAVHPTLPEGHAGGFSGAAIKFHPSGRMLFTSTRGSDTIAGFAVAADGALRRVTTFPVCGRTPREFAIPPGGGWLLALNHDSHEVVPFRLRPEDGVPTGEIGPVFACGAPMCAVFDGAK